MNERELFLQALDIPDSAERAAAPAGRQAL
jgi:hypothetical protein